MNLHSAVNERWRERKAEQKEMRNWLKKHEKEINRVLDALKVVHKWQINLTLDHNAIDLQYSGDRLVFKGIFAAFLRAGYTPTTRPTEKIFTSHTTWFMHKTDASENPRFYVTFTSTVCRRVKIGTKTVEHDTFEVICD